MILKPTGSGAPAWAFLLLFAAVCFFVRGDLPWVLEFPDEWAWPISDSVNQLTQWFVKHFSVIFRGLSAALSVPMTVLQALLQWLPWPATVAGFVVLAYVSNGWRLALFTLLALLYMVVSGFWREGMNTLTMVFISVPVSVTLGFILGVWAYGSRRANAVIQPALDLMQTVPTFAYLIPILLLFGFGPVVGLIASAIYACPPMVRNVILALKGVPPEVVESALMSGATWRQLFWWVKVPAALPGIMVGVNQSTMAALSMVIIAAIIGSYADIGWEVLSTMRKAQFGQSLLAGVVIALIAMMMDRISRGFTFRERFFAREGSMIHRHRFLLLAVGAMVLLTLVAQWVPLFQDYPEQFRFYPAEPINDLLTYVTTNYAYVTDALKKTVLFYFMLPLKMGFDRAISPFSWGFKLTAAMEYTYIVLSAVLAVWLLLRHSWQQAVTAVCVATILGYGFTGIPWPVFIAAVTLLSWQVAGPSVAMFSLAGLLFILFGGVWTQAMLSVYLCTAAVLVSFVVGGAVGIWAAGSDRVSAFVRPINDTLQTMPLFVLLIPVLMFFQVGDFTAFLAIIAYAVVPAIRYTEHGLRNVSVQTIEAARSMGCNSRQILWQVKMPLALPEIMLGLNQTVMFALAMLVIAALVGTKGLGQSVYIALSNADPGMGLVAGLSMALIAIITDRILQGWATHRKQSLGLGR